MGRVGAGSPVWLAGWMVDRPRCSGEILSRSVVDDIRTAAAAVIVERAGEQEGTAKRLPHTQSVAYPTATEEGAEITRRSNETKVALNSSTGDKR